MNSTSSFSSFSSRLLIFFFSCFAFHISLLLFQFASESAIEIINSEEMRTLCFSIFLICLIRAFSFFQAITSFACISFLFILQIFIMLLYSFRRSVFASFCCFFAIACSASSFVNPSTFDPCNLVQNVVICSRSFRVYIYMSS